MTYSSEINRKTFCALPFVHIANRIGGYFKACCHAEDVIVDENGNPFKTSQGDTFERAFQSKYMQTLRENLKKGIRDERCRMCWNLEDQGIKSKRLHDGNRFLSEALVRATSKEVEFAPLSWDIKLGSKCNLRCRICNDETSTSILKENVDRGIRTAASAQSYIKEAGDLLTYEHFKDELTSIAPHAREVYFLGGEPTLMRSHLDIVDTLIEKDLASKMTLRWSTNLAQFDERFFERAAKFKDVIIDCSVDGYGYVNDYIRDKSLWPEVEQKLLEIKSRLPAAKQKIICTINVYNIWTLDQLVAWGRAHDIAVAFNYLDHPPYLSVQILPQEAKLWIIHHYESLQDPCYEELVAWVRVERNPKLMSQFWSFTRDLDRTRNQSFFDILPQEVRGLFEKPQLATY